MRIHSSIWLDCVAIGLFVMTPLVVFISSLSVFVAALTRTFQQAQGYLFPLLLVTLFLASAAQIPELADNVFFESCTDC